MRRAHPGPPSRSSASAKPEAGQGTCPGGEPAAGVGATSPRPFSLPSGPAAAATVIIPPPGRPLHLSRGQWRPLPRCRWGHVARATGSGSSRDALPVYRKRLLGKFPKRHLSLVPPLMDLQGQQCPRPWRGGRYCPRRGPRRLGAGLGKSPPGEPQFACP